MSMTKVSPDVKPLNQPTTATCWLTCLEMIFNWKADKGQSGKTRDEILSAMDKSPILFPYNMVNVGIDHGEAKETAKMLGLRWAGGGDIDGGALETVLKTYGPVWIAGCWYLGLSHVIVITACEAATGKIKYVNPYKNFTLEETPGTLQWLNDGRGHWKPIDGSIMYA